MSPSRRRAARRGAWLGIVPPRRVPLRYGAAALPRVRVNGRRALRGYGGAHRDAPRKTLSVCYSPCSRALPGRRDRDIAPYRHYTRRISHAHYRTATGHALALHHRARRSCPVARSRGRAHRSCPVAVGRDVPIAPPRRPARCVAWHPVRRRVPLPGPIAHPLAALPRPLLARAAPSPRSLHARPTRRAPRHPPVAARHPAWQNIADW